MVMRDRHITFGDLDLMVGFPLIYSDFEEEVPEPKVNKVNVPAGADVDITEALGPVAFHNGTHTFKLLMFTADLEEQLRLLRSKIHGKRESYLLSWDPGYAYVGRWEISSIDYLTEEAALLTVTVDRYPWRTASEQVDLVAHPSASYTMEGSERYTDLTIKFLQAGTLSIDGGEAVEYAAGTHHIAGQFFGDTDITVTVEDWYYYVDGTDLIVNPDYYTLSGTDVTFTDPPFTVDGTDIACAGEASQHVTVSFTRRDL